MSFPSAGTNLGINQSLLGIDIVTRDPVTYEERVSDLKHSVSRITINTVLTVIVSALVLVAVLSIYDVIKAWLNRHYIEIALDNPKANYSKEEIERTLIENTENLRSVSIFALITVISAIVIIGLIIYYSYLKTKDVL